MSTYQAAGVDSRAVPQALESLFSSIRSTRPEGRADVEFGHFASVVDVGGVGIAISTDGVGTKTIVAQLTNTYDTIGVDCVAVNVNDVICVGAKPVAMVDYLAVQRMNPDVLAQIGRGMARGARQADVSIVGGETAQLPEVIKGEAEGTGLDLAGTCIGRVALGQAITGRTIVPGDAIVALLSSGLHSNGFTLARKAFGLTPDRSWAEKSKALEQYVPELRTTLGEELLKPTRIYVREVMRMLDRRLSIKGLAHITGDGLLNLPRLEADVGYVIDTLPDPPPVFELIRRGGRDTVPESEMFEVFNMGIGFCVVVGESDAQRVVEAAGELGCPAMRIGHVVQDPNRAVTVEPVGLKGYRSAGFSTL